MTSTFQLKLTYYILFCRIKRDNLVYLILISEKKEKKHNTSLILKHK